jgi:hypothetical protein
MLRQPRQNISQPSLRVELVDLAGLEQNVQCRGSMAAEIRTGKRPVLARNSNSTERPLGRVVRQADPPVLEET